MVKQCLYMMIFKQLYRATKGKWLFLPGNCARLVFLVQELSAVFLCTCTFLSCQSSECHYSLTHLFEGFKKDLCFLCFEMQRFHDSIAHMKDIADFINVYLQKMTEESSKLGVHASQIEEIQIKSISEFQQAFEVGCSSFCA